ncbi:ATP-grasp domain-containing protein [Streptosporangium sp. CA-135522]|uniref:ATP-grasp domain-containing protein n=1 Tax=Streptosporangium sp. CA-135522 TaxID=3240072 RepID=UPI003D92DBC2
MTPEKTPERTLLLIGHQTSTVRKAKALGLAVILLQHRSKFEPEQAELADVLLLADYTDPSVARPLIEAAHRAWGFSAAVSLTEPGLEVAGWANDRFGLGGTGFAASHRLRDKWEMRRHLAGSGAKTIGASLVRDRDSLAAFGAAHGYPFIVKPTDVAGGFGVFRVGGAAEVDDAWDRVQRVRRTGVDRGPTDLFRIGEFIMEEYVSGPEYSVEAFSFGGRHVVIAVTEKLVDEAHFAELGHALPARLDLGAEQEIVAAVTAFLDVIGIADGPSHTEVRVGRDGPVVIESHNRIGGDHIDELVEAAYGVDMAAYAVGWPFGLVEELAGRPRPLAGACVRFVHTGAGRIEGVEGVETVRARPDVLIAQVTASAGDVVRPLADNWDRLGLVAVRGSDTDAAVRLCEDLVANSVNIRLRPAARV